MVFFFSSRRRHTRYWRDWSSDVCSSDLFLLDPDDAASIAQAEALNATLVDDALARGGTCTGEHGIGYGKLGYLELEHGDLRSEERRVGKECRSRLSLYQYKKQTKVNEAV